MARSVGGRGKESMTLLDGGNSRSEKYLAVSAISDD